MNYLRDSIALRWSLAWIIASSALAGISFLRNGTYFGSSFQTQLFGILIFSAPWFLWGEIFVRFVRIQSEYSFFRRCVSALGLLILLIAILIWTTLPLIDI